MANYHNGYVQGAPQNQLAPPPYQQAPPPYQQAANMHYTNNPSYQPPVQNVAYPPGQHQVNTNNSRSFQTNAPFISADICSWFKAVDRDGNGEITATELQHALINGNWSPFNAETCRLMIGMFDVNHNGTIDINEFQSLWKYITDWKNCFDRFDIDRSGTIDANELHIAFNSFGFSLSKNFADLCVRVFDRHDRRSIKFDDFIQCSVMLKCLSDKFKEKDQQRKGVVTIYYEEES